MMTALAAAAPVGTGLRGSIYEGASPAALKPVFVKPLASGTVIQLGAYSSDAVARIAWQKIAEAAPQVLHGLVPRTQPVAVHGQQLWRLRTAVADVKTAQAVCQSLRQLGQACVIAP